MENDTNIKWDKTWGCINKARHLSRVFTVTTLVCSNHDTTVNNTKRYESWIHNEKEHNPLINHLLFMDDLKLYGSNKNQLDSLIQTVRIFSEDIHMKFGLDKCAILEMK